MKTPMNNQAEVIQFAFNQTEIKHCCGYISVLLIIGYDEVLILLQFLHLSYIYNNTSDNDLSVGIQCSVGTVCVDGYSVPVVH
jgi:hypothetical protein